MAGTCLALELPDACVFHLMGVLERGLLALVKKLRMRDPLRVVQGTWGPIVKEIDARISKLRPKSAVVANGTKHFYRGSTLAKRKQLIEGYASASKEFGYFAEAWRNRNAHRRYNYDQDQAASIMNHVQEFMKSLVDIGIREKL